MSGKHGARGKCLRNMELVENVWETWSSWKMSDNHGADGICLRNIKLMSDKHGTHGT